MKSKSVKSRDKLTGKLAVITGADSGIGLEFTRCLAGMGATPLMISNRPEPLLEAAAAIASSYGCQPVTLCLDLTEADAPRRLFAFMLEHELEPYIVINNAGIFSFDTIERTSERRISAFIDLHIRALTEISRRAAILMGELGRGYILNMSSMSCWMPMPGLAMYSATKAYIRVFSRSLAYEMSDKGVHVMVACPGGIATSLFGLGEKLKKFAVSIGVLQTPQTFARKAVRQMLRGRSQYINGMLNRISILAVGCTPRAVRMMVKHRMLDRNIRRP